LALSGKLRRQIHFFISTHFYVNKYEYRDEWLALSSLLQGALTEADVAASVRQILADSLYTTNIIIWLGDSDQGYRTVFPNQDQPGKAGADAIAPNDPLVQFLQTHPYFDVDDKEPEKAWKAVMKTKDGFLTDLDLVLTAPLFIGDQLIGLIGLGPEFTGGRYGHDDFDLLIAVGTQAASALMAVRMAEKLAAARERQAWDKLSAFVLHDIKNAANMLSLARENARNHIRNPMFQQDLLETVDDALGRMNKVQDRLGMLKPEAMPEFQDMELCQFLKDLCGQFEKKQKVIDITLDCRIAIPLYSDPEILARIMENLVLNAMEAGGKGTEVRINAFYNENQRQAVIEVTDNGPGIPQHILPDALFEPYKTTKPGGSGIGLWQVKQHMQGLNGTVSAENAAGGGARFVLRLPWEGVDNFSNQ
jgi:putative PEP-CTERM system histidine kinase